MAKIFTRTKTVAPRQIIKSKDMNDLQTALESSFDSLGDAPPSGYKGVSTPFYVGTATEGNHAVTKDQHDTGVSEVSANAVLAEDARVAAEAAEDGAVAAQIAAEAAQSAASSSAAQASSDRTAAANSATAAASSASSASTQASNAASSASGASSSASAAASSASAASTSETNAATSEGIALTYRNEASSFASDAASASGSASGFATAAANSASEAAANQTKLFYGSDEAVATLSTGIRVRQPGSDNPSITFSDDTATTLSTFEHVKGFGLTLYTADHGAIFQVRGEDSGGVVRTLLHLDPDGDFEAYYRGNEALSTYSSGIEVTSPTSRDPVISFLPAPDDTRNGYLQFRESGNIVLRNEIEGGPIYLVGTSSSGIQRNTMYGDPDGGAYLYNAGAETLRTVSRAAGGVEVYNSKTGSGYERALTEGGDYEEGTYAPTLTVGAGNAYLDTSRNVLSYRRIGNICHVYGSVRINSVSSPGGTSTLTLPFVSANLAETSDDFLAVFIGTGMATANPSDCAVQIQPNNGTAVLRRMSSNQYSTNLSTDLQPGSELHFSFSYPIG